MAQNRSFEKPAIDTVRMSQQELAFVLAEIERQGRIGVGRELRQEDRHGCEQGNATLVRVDHPGGTAVDLIVRPRNISRQGIGFLNGSYIYIGTRLSFHLTSLDDQKHIVTGKVVRCHHIRGLVHDVGVRLDAPLDLSQFVRGVDPDGCAPSGDKAGKKRPRFHGTALCVDDSIDDRELCRFMLERLGLTVQTVSSGRQAQQLVESQHFDIVLSDLWLKDIDGFRFAYTLRQFGHNGRVVAMVVDNDVDIETRAIQHGYDFVISKPMSESASRELAGRFLKQRSSSPGAEGQALLSTSWEDKDMRPLIVGFLGRIDRQIRNIAQLAEVANFEALHLACRQLKGTAAGYGFPTIAEVADHLQTLAAVKAQQEHLQCQVNELTQLCDAARVVLNSPDAPSS